MSGLRVMYDAVDVAALPAGGDLYLGYVDGVDTAGNAAAVRSRFPSARIVPATTTGGTLDAVVADVERYDLTIPGGATWAAAKLYHGQVPTLYVSLAAWDSLRAAVAAACGPLAAQVCYGVAAYPGCGPALYPGSVFHQYASTTFDTSVVTDYWPGVDPPPAAPIGDAMLYLRNPDTGAEYAATLTTAGTWAVRHLSGPEAAVVAANGRRIPDATLEQLAAFGIS